MPRDANGNMTLPAGNPVVTDTLITSVWANTTMGDLRNEMTDSLSRSGKGAMLASLGIVDGTKTSPGLNGASEPTSGLYRAGDGDWRFSVLNTDVAQWTTAGQMVQATNTSTARALKDHLGAFVTPEMWGATGDGAADDTTALQSAVNDGRAIWCEKTYLVTANITGFHSARWMGPGNVKMGTSSWLVAPYSPATDRTLYVSPTGDDNNMGLDPSNAVKTLQKAVDYMNSYPDYIPGGFIFEHAAGTYTNAAIFTPTSRYEDAGKLNARRIKISGPVTGGLTPTAIYDNVTGGSSTTVLRFFGRQLVTVNDIRFTNNATRRAIDAQNQVILDCRNVWVDNGQDGININIQGRLWVRGGEFKTLSNNGIEIVAGSVYTITRDDQAGNKLPLISACNVGIRVSECSTGHADYMIVQDCVTSGVDLSRACRMVCGGDVTIQRCIFGIRLYGCFIDNTQPIDFKTGTVDSNTVNIQYYGPSYDPWTSPLDPTLMCKINEGVNIPHNGATTPTLLWDSSSETPNRLANRSQLYSLPGGQMTRLGKGIRVKFAGIYTGTAGTKTLDVKLGGVSVGKPTAAAGQTGAWLLEIDINHQWNDESNQQIVIMRYEENGNPPVITYQQTTIDMTVAAAKAVTLEATLAVGTDIINVHLAQLYQLQ